MSIVSLHNIENVAAWLNQTKVGVQSISKKKTFAIGTQKTFPCEARFKGKRMQTRV